MRELAGPGPFTVFAPASTAFNEDLRVSMKQWAGEGGLGQEHSSVVSS